MDFTVFPSPGTENWPEGSYTARRGRNFKRKVCAAWEPLGEERSSPGQEALWFKTNLLWRIPHYLRIDNIGLNVGGISVLWNGCFILVPCNSLVSFSAHSSLTTFWQSALASSALQPWVRCRAGSWRKETQFNTTIELGQSCGHDLPATCWAQARLSGGWLLTWELRIKGVAHGLILATVFSLDNWPVTFAQPQICTQPWTNQCLSTLSVKPCPALLKGAWF